MGFSLSARLCRSFLSNPTKSFTPFTASSYCTNHFSFNENTTETAADVEGHVSDSVPEVEDVSKRPVYVDRPLENGLDYGIYKAILVGQVGQNPIQKKLRSGRTVTLLSIGTGGIRNNRRPLENEEPKDYANRCAVQWHRVSIYREKLGDVAVKHVTPGSLLYLEGNLETKVFSDPVTGLVRRIREVAIRQTGRLVFLGQGNNSQKSPVGEVKGVGYF
ncbi:single-stranded DNA-binding protein, mitochondrial [Heracleum sosnowskyi]|uniref:Single-stranded DNA-binding protein, mitochondrial n=1 Tax=Heracleum sosnowskyi TaxID=360622 RepID=A0AAD8IP94_9APIA|nr:single-stranded DNA-binding protein, mitochondrial [Heracleum sosnowskyi]